MLLIHLGFVNMFGSLFSLCLSFSLSLGLIIHVVKYICLNWYILIPTPSFSIWYFCFETYFKFSVKIQTSKIYWNPKGDFLFFTFRYVSISLSNSKKKKISSPSRVDVNFIFRITSKLKNKLFREFFSLIFRTGIWSLIFFLKFQTTTFIP